jgi:murein DD-endopeptidase MepM/ murein hydrolase activator NlpD
MYTIDTVIFKIKYRKKLKGVVFCLSQNNQTVEKKLPPFSQLSVKWRVGLILGLLFGVVLLGYTLKDLQTACAVEVDGETIAIVSSEGEAKAVIKTLADQQTKEFGKPVVVKQQIEYKKTKKDKQALIDSKELQKKLSALLIYQLDGALVKVDGKVQYVFQDKKQADQFISELKKEYQIVDNAKVEFKEKVEVIETKVTTDKLTTVKTALANTKEAGAIPYYIVQEGDTLWDVATVNGISVEELTEFNPDFKPELMQIGQKLKLDDKQPLINVVSTFEKVVEESVPAPQEVRRNNTMLQGKSKVIQAGQEGLKEVKYQVVAKNGEESKKIVVAENTLKEPVPEIVEKGTRSLVATRNFGGGRLAKPAGGSITSPFGGRWGSMHEGIDLGAANGSAVVAAESGTVIRSGTYGNYGNCIDVSHGNGMVTRYAHLSKRSVSVGQSVQRGQVIGAVGNTGRSTGPHLHFEVLINGSPKNPVNYL